MTDTVAIDNHASVASVFDLPFTDKQRKFVQAYVGESRFNAADAARRAGYPKKNADVIGYQLRRTSYISEWITQLLEAESLTGREVLRELTDVAMRPLDSFITIIATDREGNPIAAKMDASAKMKALELLGKAHGLFTDKMDINLKSVHVELNGIDIDRIGNVIEAEGDVQE